MVCGGDEEGGREGEEKEWSWSRECVVTGHRTWVDNYGGLRRA